MRSFLNLLATFLISAGISITPAAAASETAKDSKNPAKEQKGDKKKKTKETNDSGKENGLSLPIPSGHPQKGVKLPIHGANGALKMYFTIGTATRVSERDVSMKDLSVQMYKETGELELDLEFPEAIMNVKTGEIATDTHVTIRRSDFEISGNKMIYNTNTKAGTLTNGVRMIIYDLASLNQDKKSDSKKVSVDVNPSSK